MAFRQIRAARPVAFGASALVTALLTTSPVYAQESVSRTAEKKPLYDPPAYDPPTAHTPTTTPTTTPTPTERLAVHIGTARRFIHAHTTLAQRELDAAFSRYLNLEHNITSTIAALAPPKSSQEKVVPGLLYVAVSTMAGSIIARRRMLPVRVLTPVAVAVGAGWYFLPETMGNVAGLVWEWEKKVPGVAEFHEDVRGRVERGVTGAVGAVRDGRREVDVVVGRARKMVEGWVKKSGSE